MEKIYREKILDISAEEKKKMVVSRYMLFAKLVSFGLAVWLAYESFIEIKYLIYCIIAISAYIFAYIYDDGCMKRLEHFRRMRKVCKDEIAALKGDFSSFDVGSRYVDPGHPYTYDLDVFGPSSLFNRINRTVTGRGSDRLAEKLSQLSQNCSTILKNQQAIRELSDMVEWRIGFMAKKQPESRLDKLMEQLSGISEKGGQISRILPYISIAITLVLMVLAITDVISSTWFFMMFLVQLSAVSILSRKTGKAVRNLEGLHKEFSGYIDILEDIRTAGFHSEILCGLKGDLFNGEADCMVAFKKLSGLVGMYDQRGNLIMYVLMNGIFLFDVLLNRRFQKWQEKYSPYVKIWMDAIAETDALTSLAAYAFNHPGNCMPEILEEESEDVIQAKNVYHTFLSENKAVPNTFTLKKKNIAIITGANMAGKSTFLRTIGITYILAVSGVPVCAESFRFSIISLFSSMRTTDNLSKEISYFNAELLRLKQLLEFVRSHNFTLIILDEILKGTNSQDKLKGSVMFLNEISGYDISAVIATHDLELAKLEEEQKDIYRNYCFEIELSDEINYTYRIKEGVARNMNASYLLQNLLKDKGRLK